MAGVLSAPQLGVPVRGVLRFFHESACRVPVPGAGTLMTALPPPHHRIAVLGGYGHFGGRICRALACGCDAELVVTGRSATRGQAFARSLRRLSPGARVGSAVLDRSASSFERDLQELAPTIVVHAAGPFQDQDYRVAAACIRLGSQYVDLADGRRFVAEFPSLDRMAKDRGVLLVAGASTLPAVSSAVVDHLGADLVGVERIDTAILPANRTERGRGTVAAVFSYVGKRIRVFQGGEWTTQYGWLDVRRVDHPTCGRWAGACDVPDLEVFLARYPSVKTVTFHAGLELGWQQWGMWLMAWLTRLGVVSDWSRYAGGFARVSARLICLGTDVGGMQVCVLGRTSTGARVNRTWNLTAGNNHGPEIPCIPARVVAMKLARNELRQRGAIPGTGLMSLAEFDTAARGLDIQWDVAERAA